MESCDLICGELVIQTAVLLTDHWAVVEVVQNWRMMFVVVVGVDRL